MFEPLRSSPNPETSVAQELVKLCIFFMEKHLWRFMKYNIEPEKKPQKVGLVTLSVWFCRFYLYKLRQESLHVYSRRIQP